MSKLAVIIAVIGISIYLLSVYMKPGICESKDRLDGKIAIVTGGNNGIGFETVRDFLSRGAKVYIACRSVEKGEAAAKELKKAPGITDSNVVVMHLELESQQSVRKFAEEFHKREQQLHILVNNAGTGSVNRTLTVDGFEKIFAVNHLGHFLLTNLLMDLLTAAKPSRIVTVSSYAHRKGEINFDDINMEKDFGSLKSYRRSKLANVLFSNELGRRLQGSGVTTYSLHPGLIFTDIFRNAFPPITTNEYMYRILEFLLSPVNKNVWEGAQTTICCAVDSKLEHVTGKYYSDCEEVEPIAAALDVNIARRLWDVSVAMVKLQDSEIHPLLKNAV